MATVLATVTMQMQDSQSDARAGEHCLLIKLFVALSLDAVNIGVVKK